MAAPLIVDACQLITFGAAARLSLVAELSDRAVLTAERVRSEILKPPARDAVAEAVARGTISVETVNLEIEAEADALARFDGRPAFRGRGEAELLALAAVRGYVVGSDELAVRRTVALELGANRIATSLDILIWAVRQRRLELSEADQLLDELDVGAGIHRALDSRGARLADFI